MSSGGERPTPPGPLQETSSSPAIAGLAERLDEIGKAVEDRLALEAQLSRAMAELIELREARLEAAKAVASLEEAQALLALRQQAQQDTEASLRDMSQSLASLMDEREALAEELNIVKKKYRRASSNAQTATGEVTALSQQLADAQARLAAIERRPVAAFFARLAHGGMVARIMAGRSLKARGTKQMDVVRNSHLFDADWYLATYPDVAEARIDAVTHYVVDGWSEGRDPGPEFSTSGYLKANPDIAQAGINPLVHYLEHGLAEGRSAGGGGSARPRRSIEDFGPPFAVYQSSVEPGEPVRWLRHYQLDTSRPHLRIGDQASGYRPDGAMPAVAVALGRFWRLSGLAGEPPLAAEVGEPCSDGAPIMLDGWFPRQSLFRSRWEVGETPPVIRGYQRGTDGSVGLIGEALVNSALDIVDFPSAHSLFPILFLACRADGQIEGAANLFFPSLCRGGLHYAEVLLDGAGEQSSPMGLGDRHARALEAILAGEADALLQSVQMDLAGADGTRPMFQSDCQEWLDLIMRVDVGEPIAPAGAERAEIRFLTDRASGAPGHHIERASATSKLVIPSDCLPTIAALVAWSSGDTARVSDAAMSIAVVHADPAKPALAVAVPHGVVLPAVTPRAAFPIAFPRLTGAAPPDQHVPAAIRTLVERGLSESELLQPLAQPLQILPTPAMSREVTVAIEPALWPLPALEGGLAALDLQIGSEQITICTIGPVDAQRRAMIERAFGGRTVSRINVHAFVDGLTDADVLHLGPSVILHDSRTLQTFQSLLAEASSASCPVITCTRQGKNWAVGVADAGRALAWSGETGPLPLARYADILWRSIFPVVAQPSNLWAARPDVIRNAPEEASAPHLFCEMVTASYWEGEPDVEPTLTLPPARADLALRVDELIG